MASRLATPKLWYPCEEANGNLVDATGTLDLTAAGGPTSVAGKVGNARHCAAASSQSFSATDNAAAEASAAGLTVGGWWYLDSLPGVGATFGLMQKNLTTGNQRSWALATNNAGNLQWILNSDGTASGDARVTSPNPLPVGQWLFIVGVWRPGLMRLWLNGVVVASAAGPSAIFDGTAPLQVMRGQGSTTHTDGACDELLLYDVGLMSAEVWWLYKGGNGRAYADLAGAPDLLPLPPYLTRSRMRSFQFSEFGM